MVIDPTNYGARRSQDQAAVAAAGGGERHQMSVRTCTVQGGAE